jgi:hypothetical protein
MTRVLGFRFFPHRAEQPRSNGEGSSPWRKGEKGSGVWHIMPGLARLCEEERQPHQQTQSDRLLLWMALKAAKQPQVRLHHLHLCHRTPRFARFGPVTTEALSGLGQGYDTIHHLILGNWGLDLSLRL